MIRADGGRIHIIANSQTGSDLSVIEHTGVTQARTLADGKKGEIMLLAEGTQVSVTGLLDVSAEVSGIGGKIVITGAYLKIEEHAKLTADGVNGGGEIYTGGGWMGSDPAISRATGTYVSSSAIIRANALKKGDGGTVVAYSDVKSPNSVTRAYGLFEANGGSEGGNGGRIETSGGWLDVAGSRGGASALNGDAGTWLYDPYDITIGSTTTSNGSWSGGIFTPNGNNATIASYEISALLNSGTNVTISTSGGGAQKGSITLESGYTISKSAGPDVTLTLNADYRINIQAYITTSFNKLHLIAEAGKSAIGDGNGRIGQFNLTSTGGIVTRGGNVTIIGVNNSVVGGSWNTYTCSGATCRGIQIDGSINAGGGNISLTGLGRTGGVTRGVNIANSVVTNGSGAITIDGQGDGDAYGTVIEGTGKVTTVNGNITIKGYSENPSTKAGIFATATPNIATTGTGNVSLISTNGAIVADALILKSKTTTNLSATGYNIALNNWQNVFTGAVTVNAGADVSITSDANITLGTVSTTGTVNIGSLSIIISGGSVSTTTSGTILLYTGKVSGSTGVTGLSNYNSSRVYFSSDENTTLSPTPGNGLYVVYRDTGTVKLSPSTPTSITATSNPICTGSSTQLTAIGAVGTVYWYTGSCGGTLVTTGNPINVNPAASTTYYAKNYNNSFTAMGALPCWSLLNSRLFQGL